MTCHSVILKAGRTWPSFIGVQQVDDSVRSFPLFKSRGLPLLLLGAVGCAPALSSGNPTPIDARQVQPERPSVATHAGTVAPGYLEIETGIESDRTTDGTHVFTVPTVAKIGLAPRVQLSLFLPVESATGVALGAGDFSAGIKWRLVDGDGPLQRFAILPFVKVPTGGDRGTNTTDAGLILIDSRSIGPASLDLNVGLTQHGGNGSTVPRTTTFWTASGGFSVAGPLGWQLECFGFPGAHGPASNPPTVAILTGPTLGAWRTLALDAGVIIPVAGQQPRGVYAGLVTNVGRVLPIH
jgi:outer membrane putative beta-barrel porin/alpha-amylase